MAIPPRESDEKPQRRDQNENPDTDGEAPETPLDEPPPVPVDDPPAEPRERGPYVV